MKATPLIINWHDQNAPIYSAHFEPHGKGRLATAAGDNNVRLWNIKGDGEDRIAEYIATLSKHTQAVNVVRWAPKGELLASAGDDGNVILWVPSEVHQPAFGSEGLEEKETWRAKHMCRSSGTEIFDLAWSPDGTYFIIGSMDNVARIYKASTGTLVRQIAEHSHYVQGVCWDPLNEFIATQSSDRSVHIYSLKTKDGQYTLNNHDEKTPRLATHARLDYLPPRRISSHSPAPPDLSHRFILASLESGSAATSSPVPSAPGTPTQLPMNPPSVVSHSRRSSFSSRRSVSPAPSMPLPAVMSMEASPKPHPTSTSLGVKNPQLYASETLTSFFRRLTFTPDGSLLLTPAGLYQTQQMTGSGKVLEVINTVYIYTRGGINNPPIAHLPGHKKPSVAVRCSPVYYTLRQAQRDTKTITIDTSSPEDPIPSLPEPLTNPSPALSVMDPPPLPVALDTSTPGPKSLNTDTNTSASAGPKPVFALPYRMVYAVATQDSVLLYDTQQTTPICIVSNLHLATFTDLAWSSDGLTLMITSSDGFCSALSFSTSELGQAYTGELRPQNQATTMTNQNTPVPTSNSVFAPPSPYANGAFHQHRDSTSSMTAPSPPLTAAFTGARPASPARSNSTSSVMTQTSAAPGGGVMCNPPLIAGQVPSIAVTNSAKVTGVPMTTPPETPRPINAVTAVASASTKREHNASEMEDPGSKTKKRRIAPTSVASSTS